ncbi:hypothetical protein [Ornithinimicrobium flavum]|uniref:hypothetical protein n=1 Tax=Ornithinimicrobium flavum TaxID=1288636 RepID=UPI001930F689|nr:hypothetical protein [Ornithinimicrobium flavum]
MLSILMPVLGEPLSVGSLTLWAIVVTLVAIVTLYSNNYGLIADPRLRGGRFASVALWVSAIAIMALGVYSIVQVFSD